MNLLGSKQEMPSEASKLLQVEVQEKWWIFPTKTGIGGWEAYHTQAQAEAAAKGISFPDLLRDDIQELEAIGRVGQWHEWALIGVDFVSGLGAPTPAAELADKYGLSIDSDLYDAAEMEEFVRMSWAADYLKAKLVDYPQAGQQATTEHTMEVDHTIVNSKASSSSSFSSYYPAAPPRPSFNTTPEWTKNVQGLLNQPSVMVPMAQALIDSDSKSTLISNIGFTGLSLGGSNMIGAAIGFCSLNPWAIPIAALGAGIAWWASRYKEKHRNYGYHFTGKHVVSLSVVTDKKKHTAVLEYLDEAGNRQTIKSKSCHSHQQALDDVKTKYCGKFNIDPSLLTMQKQDKIVHVCPHPDIKLANEITNLPLTGLNSWQQMKLRSALNPLNPDNYPDYQLSPDYPGKLSGRPVVVDYTEKGKHGCIITDVITNHRYGPYRDLTQARAHFAAAAMTTANTTSSNNNEQLANPQFVDGLQIPQGKRAIQLPHNGLLVAETSLSQAEIEQLKAAVKNKFIIVQNGNIFSIFNVEGAAVGQLKQVKYDEKKDNDNDRNQLTDGLMEVDSIDEKVNTYRLAEQLWTSYASSNSSLPISFDLNGQNVQFSYEVVGEQIIGHFVKGAETVSLVLSGVRDPVGTTITSVAGVLGGPLLAVPISILL